MKYPIPVRFLLFFIATLATVLLTRSARSQEIEALCVGSLEANCYILADAESHSAVVIDPGADGPAILKRLSERGLALRAVFVTHAHEDHLGACAAVVAGHDVPVFIHQADLAMAQRLCPKVHFQTISKEGPITVTPFTLEVIDTPGHTPGSVCFRWKDVNLFSGDTLFRLDLGKCADLPALAKTVQEKLMSLPDATKVYPGHGPATSVGFERKHNTWLSGNTEVASPMLWMDDLAASQQRAKDEGKLLLVFLTVKSWPCAHGYEESLFQDKTVTGLASKMVDCRLDAWEHPEFLADYPIRKDPSHLPVVVVYDSGGVLLDVLEKLPDRTVADCLAAILKGKRPLEEFRVLEAKSAKTAEDSLAMGGYEKDRNRLDEALFHLESSRKAAGSDSSGAARAERLLIAVYTERGELDNALETVETLDAREGVLGENEKAELQLKRCLLHYRKKDYTRCLAETDAFIGKYAGLYDTGQVRLVRGLCHLAGGKNEEAVAEFRKSAEGASDTLAAKALYLEGYCYLVQTKYDSAAEAFAKLVRLYPDSEYSEKAADYLSKIGNKK